VRARTAGRLIYPSRFRTGLRTGEKVRAGEVLFEVEDPEVRSQRMEAEINARAADAELDRARRGFEGGFLPEAELKRKELDAELAHERQENARRRVGRLTHEAPVTGRLEVEEVLPPGAEVESGHVLAEVVGDGSPRVEAWAAAHQLSQLRPGLPARCFTPGGKTLVGRGEVREVGAEVDAAGTVRVVVEITEDLAMPPTGEGLEVEVVLEPIPGVLTVPEEALIFEGGVARAFVLSESGGDYVAQVRTVQVGGRHGGRVAIRGGMEEGERVAVLGAELLADGLRAVEAEDDEPEGP
jgi:RND family efflux transporter MFP subunit